MFAKNKCNLEPLLIPCMYEYRVNYYNFIAAGYLIAGKIKELAISLSTFIKFNYL